MAQKLKLTKRSVEALRTEKSEEMFWDTELTGLGVRVFASGAKTYLFSYRSQRTRTMRKFKIGRHGRLTVELARKEAKRVSGLVAAGEDPSSDRSEERRAPTVDGLWESWWAAHVTQKLKPRTQEEYARTYRNHVRPVIGRLKVKDVVLADIERVILPLQHTRYQANRTRTLLQTLFEYAAKRGERRGLENPARYAPRYKEERRKRILSDGEFGRLVSAIDELEAEGAIARSAAAAFRLLMMTGARKNEIRQLRWEEIDGDVARLPDSKTGKKEIFLSGQAIDYLAKLPRAEDNPFVLPGDVPGQAFVGLKKSWERIRRRSGVTDARIHDLRHYYVSKLANSGMPIHYVKELVGHKQLSTTERYLHKDEDVLRRAANQGAGLINLGGRAASG